MTWVWPHFVGDLGLGSPGWVDDVRHGGVAARTMLLVGNELMTGGVRSFVCTCGYGGGILCLGAVCPACTLCTVQLVGV